MKILVLDRSPYGNAADPRSNALLADAAARRMGHEAEVRDADRLGEGTPAAQVVLARADLRSPEDLESYAATLRRLEGQGVRCFPSADGLVAAEDKRRTQELLGLAGLPVVPTLVVGISAEGEVLPGESFPSSAVVLKEPVGWGGRGFTVCRDAEDLRRAAATFGPHRRGGTLLLQSFVRHCRGITVQVAGGRAVGAFATPGRADSAPVPEVYEDVVADDATASLAVRAVAACGLAFGSVDFADAEDGTRPILEVNAMPGLDPDDAGDRAFAEAVVRAVTGDGVTAALRVLLVVPFPLGERRGNSVSAARHRAALVAAGHRAETAVAADEDAVRRAAGELRPDVVHAIHAFRAGPAAARAAAETGAPLVVSFRGTDSHAGLEDPALRRIVERVVASAARVTALTDDEAARVLHAFPALRGRVSVVVHAVEVPAIDRDAARGALGLRRDEVVVAHVAGIRRVKGFPGAWPLVDALRGAEDGLRYVHAGPLLDPDLGDAADAWFAARPWALRLGPVARDEALRALAAADVSLHSSFVEGLSNALLESMALGTVPLARDIAASRAVVTDGADGLLFRDDAEAVAALRRLRSDPGLAARLSAAARRTVGARFSAAAETAGYLRVYGEALAATRRADGEGAPGT